MPPTKPRRSVIAHHLVWTSYGTWLPNDPRGSGSRAVATPALAELGDRHYGRRAIQPARAVVREFYEQAEGRLVFPVLHFDRRQIDSIAAGFEDAIELHGYSCYACAILPDHVHVVIRKHKHRAEAMIDNLQSTSRLRLSTGGTVPANHPVWTLGGWKTFLNTPDAVKSVIRYVENNPSKSGLAPQRWPFVKPYDNWPFHKRR